MHVFRRTISGMLKGLLIAAVSGPVVGVVIASFVGSVLLGWVIGGAVGLALAYLAVFSEDIRLEVEGNRLRYFQRGSLKQEFDLEACCTRYRVRSESSFPPSYDVDLYLRQGDADEVQIDCTPLGSRQFHELYGLIEKASPLSVQKLETVKR